MGGFCGRGKICCHENKTPESKVNIILYEGLAIKWDFSWQRFCPPLRFMGYVVSS